MVNKTYQKLAAAIEKKNNIEIKYVAPHYHRSLIAETMIQNFKSNFISVLNGVDDSLPAACWDLLIPVACIQLNILRAFTAKPENAVHSFLFDTY